MSSRAPAPPDPVTTGPTPPVPAAAGAAALTVLATASWPDPDQPDGPPQLPGFVYSSFSPLVADVAGRCLRARYGEPPLPAPVGERTALVLVTRRGDLAIARAIAESVDAGRRMSPLLFFQSVANAVLGHVAARWGVAGPVVCVSPLGDPEEEALALAGSLLDDGDADAALLLTVEQAWTPGEQDRAHATLVTRTDRAHDLHFNEGDRRADRQNPCRAAG